MPTFDGTTLVITLDSGVTEVDAKVKLYSDWKEFYKTGDNAKYAPAFDTIGGDDTTATGKVSAFFFLRNDLGWRIKPPEENINITIVGNLYGRDPTLPIIKSTTGSFTVLVNIERDASSVVETVTSGSGVTEQDKLDIADRVWDEAIADHAVAGSTSVELQAKAEPGDAMDLVTDAIDATTVAASAITEIQSGLATATAVAAIQTDTDDIQTRLPATLSGGRIRAQVESMDAGVITSTEAPNLDTTVSSRSSQTSVNAVSTNVDELLTRLSIARATLLDNLSSLDASVSSRLSSASYTAPNNAGITSIDGKVDVAVSTRLAASAYTTPDNTNILLLKKIMVNRLELAPGSTDNWILYDDDDSVLLTWNVLDKDGNPITISTGAPSKRSIGV